MSRSRLISVTAGLVAAAGVSTWLVAAGRDTPPPPRESVSNHLRNHALTHAQVFIDGVNPAPFSASALTCRFVPDDPSGTSAKFSCMVDRPDGRSEVVKVKYGRNPEIQAETAATHLLHELGFPADAVSIVPRVRCYGCPRYPFLTMQLMTLTRTTPLIERRATSDDYTDFEWVGVERKFPAPPIETETQEGWAWFELAASQTPRADLDALRLLAVFLAHWDNKAGNQRLVCLDGMVSASQPCKRPLLLIQDLGATFGPAKVNLAKWRGLPVWANREQCVVSMRSLPYQGATFVDVTISEEGRRQLAERLAALSDGRIRRLFAAARFPEFYIATDDQQDLELWTDAFRSRVDQIVHAGPCPSAAAFPSRPSPGSSS